MAAYRQAVTNIAGHFKGYQVDHIDRRLNEAADTLSRLGSQRKTVPPNVFLDVLQSPSVKLPSQEDLAIPDPEGQLVEALRAIPDWTRPYLAYLTRGEFPVEELLSRQIIRRSKSMTIVNGELHRCSVTGVFQRCVSLDEGRKILQEIHAEDIVRKCDGCQKFARQAHVSAQELLMIPITWPFASQSTIVRRQLQFSFVKKLIFQFGYPHSIITDNATDKSKGAMKEFYQREHIWLDVSSVAHPKSNGQAERANHEIL
nr:uncharacterized protein LOC109734619 [Aegilops tauschii subsp. strangulata]